MTDAEGPSRSSSGEYRAVLLLVAVGAGLLLLGFGRTWVTATSAQPGLPRVVVALSGLDLVPLGGALPLVALAGVAGLVATRGLWRRVVGALLLVAGAAGALLAVRAGLTLSDPAGEGATVDRLVGEKLGITVTGVPVVTTSWWLPAALGGLLVAVGGLLALLHGGRWSTMGRRYDREGAVTAGPEGRAESDWDLLDRGVDPTDGPAPDPGSRPAGGSGASDDPMLGNGPRS
ncbi:MAG TPA: Trp biosynthesis-associated membrane protein [Candidatus Nanopelagicales bacterium]|nr:Trp biosynthesis-associated membrane protein [Candidatus Nanopelagicales bacterium]